MWEGRKVLMHFASRTNSGRREPAVSMIEASVMSSAKTENPVDLSIFDLSTSWVVMS